MRLQPTFLLALAISLPWMTATSRAQHAGDILIGRTEGMQLTATNLPEQTRFLSPVSSGPFHGWVSSVLGFDGIVVPEPTNNIFPLNAGANVHLEVVSIDAGLSLRSFTAPASVFVDAPGERLRIGATGNLHNHPIIFIDRAVVGTNFEGQRTVSFRLVDLGTAGHVASPDYSLTFAPIVTRLAVARDGSGTTLSFEARAGLVYQMQAATNIAGPWANEGAFIIGTESPASIPFSTGINPLFFRVRATPDN
jgi:hypothetical protein